MEVVRLPLVVRLLGDRGLHARRGCAGPRRLARRTSPACSHFLGATTLPGLLVVDFYDSAIGQVAGVDTTVQVNELMEGMWGIKAIVLPGMIGFLLCLPVAALAASRARLVPAWGAAAAVAGVPIFILSGVSVPGTIGLTAAFTVFACALARGLAAEPPDA